VTTDAASTASAAGPGSTVSVLLLSPLLLPLLPLLPLLSLLPLPLLLLHKAKVIASQSRPPCRRGILLQDRED